MVERQSPLEPAWQPGVSRQFRRRVGVALDRDAAGLDRPGSPPGRGEERTLIAAIRDVTGLALPDGAGGGVVGDGASRPSAFAPGRFLVVDQNEGLGRQAEPEMHPPPPARSPTCRMAARQSASPARRPNGCWPNSSPSTSALPAFPRRRPLDRPSRHLRPDPAHRRRPVRPLCVPLLRPRRSGRRSAMPARKSATR